MPVDGTNVLIIKPSPFHRRWFSHDISEPRLRYIVSVTINGGHVVWINGPLRPGEFNDVQLFRRDLRNELRKNEKVCVDDEYGDTKCLRRCLLKKSEKVYFF